ncbi:MAG: DUF4838 domain-containing protein [Rikenellaceae bacterium]|nr:DUF4838 domain-containing protein [Rikenellaceae bacterium]
MKKLLLLLTFFLFATSSVFAGHKLFSAGKSRYSIVVCDNASKSEKSAAEELQNYLKQISGVELPIMSEKEVKKNEPHIFVGYCDKYGKMLGVESPAEGDEGFTYRNVGKNIWIYGGKQRGTMYGVYTFLEREFGIRWYTKDCTKVPEAKSWKFSELNHREKPAVGIRQMDYFDAQDAAFLAHNKVNSIWNSQVNDYGNLVGYWRCHTFEHFVNSNKYFDSHPEYFSLRDGERKPYTQLCLTNPDVLELCRKGMLQVIKEFPNYWVYSLSQNDNQNYCQCEKCTEIANRYGGQSGLLLWFVNQVADVVKEHHPDKHISTFAYQYTRGVPTGITPRDNVVIRLCSIECCFGHPLSECDHNKPFMEDIRKWKDVAGKLFIWDYVTNFRQYLAPFPNFNVLAPNIKTFIDHNVIGIYEEGQYQSTGGSFADLRTWVLNKLLWNPEQDTMALVDDFIGGYYGAAAPYVKKYFNLCHKQLKDDMVLDIYYVENHPIFSEEFLKRANKLVDKACEAVENESDELKYRVDLVRLQMKYLHLVRKPHEALEDGTYDYFVDFIRRHKIRVLEWEDVEGWIRWYNKTYLGRE